MALLVTTRDLARVLGLPIHTVKYAVSICGPDGLAIRELQRAGQIRLYGAEEVEAVLCRVAELGYRFTGKLEGSGLPVSDFVAQEFKMLDLLTADTSDDAESTPRALMSICRSSALRILGNVRRCSWREVQIASRLARLWLTASLELTEPAASCSLTSEATAQPREGG